jgi:tetratricopeptide (TPR) repeat protein
MNKGMKPKELLFAHHYSEAVEAYHNHLREHPEQNYYPGLGQALLSLGRFPEALLSFRKANEMEGQRVKGSLPHINAVGAVLWLTGERANAMTEWHHAVSGILDRSIHYGDLAGGASQGLLLWYGSITLKDADQKEYALKYLRYLKSKKVYSSSVLWPRPIVLMAVGDYSFERVLEVGAGSCDLHACIEQARKDLLKRRHLCQVLFYAACREREAGNEAGCFDMMQKCCGLENPILEEEWHLARNECLMI